ncbi:MAG: dimethylsulfonioproprionate lyase family protein [Nitratireductor sp.]
MTMRPLLEISRNYVMARPEPVVAQWFDGFDWNLEERKLPALPLEPIRHLPGVISHAGSNEQALTMAFVEAGPNLNWRRSYTPEDFGQYFFDNYAHVELIGTKGHFASEKIAAGLVLYGPHIDYPNHWHVAEEIYIPMTGNGEWSSDNQPHQNRAAGEFIFHTTNMPHAIRCGETPMLALWAWRGGDLAQKGNY